METTVSFSRLVTPFVPTNPIERHKITKTILKTHRATSEALTHCHLRQARNSPRIYLKGSTGKLQQQGEKKGREVTVKLTEVRVA